MDSFTPKYEKMSGFQRLTSYGKKYLYSVEYAIHTVKEEREETLYKYCSIPYDIIVDGEKLFEDLNKMFNYEMDRDVYDNYDAVSFIGYKVIAIYDRDLE